MTEPTAVYRLYDAEDRLLYVGITRNLARRWDQHSRAQSWWHLVTRREAEWHTDRASAEAAEITAVQSEAPQFNKDHVPNRRLGQGEYDDTADRRRVRRLLRRDARNKYFHVGRRIYVTALAERYEVSPRTLLAVLQPGSDRCFSESRRRITVLREPTF
ncbi:GIY-YIG nuclease family protein [Streptomyces sp. H49]|uniref:GIY-YIG nuclease family protein n=1 Tax=Streptomyces sp. H49 TaxID=3444117 RepID=UPI003F4ABBA3